MCAVSPTGHHHGAKQCPHVLLVYMLGTKLMSGRYFSLQVLFSDGLRKASQAMGELAPVKLRGFRRKPQKPDLSVAVPEAFGPVPQLTATLCAAQVLGHEGTASSR